MKNLKSFKKYKNLYSTTYYIVTGSYSDMSMLEQKITLMNHPDKELHHTKNSYMVSTLDAWGNFTNVKYVVGLVNAKKEALKRIA